MGSYRIAVSQHLTSYRFYHELLPQLRTYARNQEAAPILFDLTGTESVSPLVIPNLLCLGYIIRSNYDHTPTIHVPDNSASDALRSYLHDIDFVGLAKGYELFQFTDAIDYGSTRQVIDPLCATHEFNPSSKTDESIVRGHIQEHFGEFFKKYLSRFKYTPQSAAPDAAAEFTYNNLVENLCTQMVYNSLDHGKSFAFMTAQINFTLNRVFLSIADCGIGFKGSINHQIECAEEPFSDRKAKMGSELEAIVNAVFARANEVYGIYEPIRRVLELHGTVRIHSVDTRLILTENQSVNLEIASRGRNDAERARESFLRLLRDPSTGLLRRNVETGIKCGGTHIEIEIPFQREGA